MISRRTLLASLSALAGSSSRAGPLRTSIVDNDSVPLRDVASKHGLLYGAATSTGQIADVRFASVLKRECSIVVPEYEMKRGVIEATQRQYDFSGCDALLGFAAERAIKMRGHPLVWHKRNPAWLEETVLGTRDIRTLTDYIEVVARRYRGQIHSWDVVNEAIAPEDGRADGLRTSFWLKAFGPSYIDVAFHAARAADPGAMLVYNDWGCEAGQPENDRFRAATLAFLERALARGVPVDALGLQGHLAAFGPRIDQAKLARFLDGVKSLGLRILVTEHDVDDSGGPSDILLRDRAVADTSRRFLDVVLANRATVAVLSWGLSDRFLDPPNWRARLAGYMPRMLPLDADLNRKPMWHAIAKSFAFARL